MKKISLVIASFCCFIISAIAQSGDEAGVKACLENYMSGDGSRIEKAFDPTASMKYIDAKTGEFKDVPIADFIARVKANTAAPAKRQIAIESMNIEGNAAQAKIKIEYEKVILYDYMNLLKVNNEWKIVSKIFSRKDK